VIETYLEQDTFVGIRAIYQDRQYYVGPLGQYFASLSTAWDVCVELALLRGRRNAFVNARGPHSRALSQAFLLAMEKLFQETLRSGLSNDELTQKINNKLEELRALARQELGYDDRQYFDSMIMAAFNTSLENALIPRKLQVRQLGIESPMEITLAVAQGGGALGISAYAVHVLRQVLHDPDRVGSWLPRLIASWHRGFAEAEAARYERKQAEKERKQEQGFIADPEPQLIEAAECLGELPVAVVEAIGAGDPPDDLVAATGEARD
jgi:hypothetical protein